MLNAIWTKEEGEREGVTKVRKKRRKGGGDNEEKGETDGEAGDDPEPF